MAENLIRCSQISVDCATNDPVDVRCGGPEYLGFDFYVPVEQTLEMQKFIAVTLESFQVPVISIYKSDEFTLREKEVWNKARIVESIKKEADFIKSEATKNYGSTR